MLLYGLGTLSLLIGTGTLSMATPTTIPAGSLLDEKLKNPSPGKAGMIVFLLILVSGLYYIVFRLSADLSIVHQASIFPYVLLGLALLPLRWSWAR